MKIKLFLISVLASVLISCTKTGNAFYHYIDNRLTEEVVVSYSLDTAYYYNPNAERILSLSQTVPARTKSPVVLPKGYECFMPSRNYLSFVVCNTFGDTILDATPTDKQDNSAWTLEEKADRPDRYTLIDVMNYILIIDGD